MTKIYTTDPTYIKFLDCNPAVPRKIGFNLCNIIIKEGSQILSQTSLCDFKLESLGGGRNSELGGCGGSLDKKLTLKSKANYTLTAPEIGQAQGVVQMIIVKVKYPKEQKAADRYLTWEYKGNVYPLNSLMILTGRTQAEIPGQGWDLSYYSPTPPTPAFSPEIYPPVASQDLAFGGIMFNNPTEYDIELEIFIFN